MLERILRFSIERRWLVDRATFLPLISPPFNWGDTGEVPTQVWIRVVLTRETIDPGTFGPDGWDGSGLVIREAFHTIRICRLRKRRSIGHLPGVARTRVFHVESYEDPGTPDQASAGKQSSRRCRQFRFDC